jgi:methionine synthase II (cobalamin-independent)
VPTVTSRPTCIGPISYTGTDALRLDLANLKAAADAAGVEEAFVTSIAVGSLGNIVNVMLRVNAQAYSVEAGNVRHEHEYKIWHQLKLPEGKLLIPGVVSHATNVIEHPEIIADRILAYANAVGRENVIAGTDCGVGGRVHPKIAWAKLQALAEGTRLASAELW